MKSKSSPLQSCILSLVALWGLVSIPAFATFQFSVKGETLGAPCSASQALNYSPFPLSVDGRNDCWVLLGYWTGLGPKQVQIGNSLAVSPDPNVIEVLTALLLRQPVFHPPTKTTLRAPDLLLGGGHNPSTRTRPYEEASIRIAKAYAGGRVYELKELEPFLDSYSANSSSNLHHFHQCSSTNSRNSSKSPPPDSWKRE